MALPKLVLNALGFNKALQEVLDAQDTLPEAEFVAKLSELSGFTREGLEKMLPAERDEHDPVRTAKIDKLAVTLAAIQ